MVRKFLSRVVAGALEIGIVVYVAISDAVVERLRVPTTGINGL